MNDQSGVDTESDRASGERATTAGAMPWLRALAAALNHLLAQHPSARGRLAAHSGALVLMGVDSSGTTKSLPQPELWFVINAQGSLTPALPGEADVQMLIKPSLQAGLDFFAQGAIGLSPHLRVEGSVLLAGLIGELMQDLRWDYEDDLAGIVGDVAARRIGQAVSAGRSVIDDVLRSTARRFGQTVTSASERGAFPLTDRASHAMMQEQLKDLDDRVTRLEKTLGTS